MNRNKALGLKVPPQYGSSLVTRNSTQKVTNVSPPGSEDDQTSSQIRLHNNGVNLNPAGKARQHLRLARRFESAYELQQGTAKRSQ